MALFKNMYLRLFNAVTDAVARLEKGEADAACELLKRAQCETEEMYISGASTEDETDSSL